MCNHAMHIYFYNDYHKNWRLNSSVIFSSYLLLYLYDFEFIISSLRESFKLMFEKVSCVAIEESLIWLRSILHRLVAKRADIFRVIWIPVLAARKVGRSSSRCWQTPRGESLFCVEGISCSCRNEHGIVLGTKVPDLRVGKLRLVYCERDYSTCDYSKHQVFECKS